MPDTLTKLAPRCFRKQNSLVTGTVFAVFYFITNHNILVFEEHMYHGLYYYCQHKTKQNFKPYRPCYKMVIKLKNPAVTYYYRLLQLKLLYTVITKITGQCSVLPQINQIYVSIRFKVCPCLILFWINQYKSIRYRFKSNFDEGYVCKILIKVPTA